MKEKLQNLIDIAQAEVGYHEGYNNDNKYGAEYGFNNVAWCVIFAWWISKHAVVDFPTTAHCNGVESYAKEHGQWVTGPYQPGDFVIWDYDRNGERDHIGLVIEANGNAITTIEGNSGDAVRKNLYVNLGNIIGAYRPDYGGDEPDILDEPITPVDETIDIPEAVDPVQDLTMYAREALQLLLEYRGYNTRSKKLSGRMDGEAGPGTDSALMKLQGSTNVTDETWHKLIWGY